MSPTKRSAIYLGAVALAFVAVNVVLARFLSVSATKKGFFYLLLLEFVMFGYAGDLVDALYSLWPRELLPPRLTRLSEPPPVALVRCVCDDLDGAALRRTQQQDYPNLET